MYVQSLVALSIAALSLARAIPLEKRTTPKHWWSGLEAYSTYHQRYTEIGCENKHNTPFFDQCCHPRLKNDTSPFPEECHVEEDCDDDSGDDNQSAPVNVAPVPTVSVSVSVPAPSPTHKSEPSPSPKPEPKPQPPSNPAPPSGGNSISGSGKGTYFLQNGVAGACGIVHADSSEVVALDSRLYGNTGEQSKYCGKTIHITNTDNGKSVTAIVADACPTCVSYGSVDMSVGAFTQIATEAQGEVNIKWTIDL